MTKPQPADQVLDISNEVCPMTFVRTRLALDRMAPGTVLIKAHMREFGHGYSRLPGFGTRVFPATAAWTAA